MKTKKIIGITTVFFAVIILILAGLMYAGFFSPPPNVQAKAIDTYATEKSVHNLSEVMNNFSWELYKLIYNHTNENIFFSPYSIFTALAMTYEGSRGDTADQMKTVLGFDQNDIISLCSFGRIYNLLNIDTEYTLNTANALWTREGYPFLESYLNFIDNYYMGKATDIDFSNPASAAEIINTWVKENTGGKITDMLSEADVNPATVLILSNAIYFKGLWLNQFDENDTRDRDFTLANEEVIQVPMMALTDAEESFNYTEVDNAQILELPYKGNDVSMMIILPEENNVTHIAQQLDTETVLTWKKSMTPNNVDIYLPKFIFRTEYNLKQILIDMGMDVPFSSHADFSGMNGFGGLFIEKVLHKAFIEVNEEGTEAAAATTVHILETAMPEPVKVFNADHPFIFLIQHKEGGTILFMGCVNNPIA